MYSPEISFLDVAVYQKNSNAVTSFIVESAVLTTAMAGRNIVWATYQNSYHHGGWFYIFSARSVENRIDKDRICT